MAFMTLENASFLDLSTCGYCYYTSVSFYMTLWTKAKKPLYLLRIMKYVEGILRALLTWNRYHSPSKFPGHLLGGWRWTPNSIGRLESKFMDWGGSVDLLSLIELVPRPLDCAFSSLHWSPGLLLVALVLTGGWGGTTVIYRYAFPILLMPIFFLNLIPLSTTSIWEEQYIAGS